ncbi:uncharacterized protein LOC135101864 isoform X1 [Scylla paramamosain]|uniref:uncharacterized protein LOC135101864 isoform X1 n=1 Tax=Scylla paramamosain TaxID=85552 RepID=UPI0030838329
MAARWSSESVVAEHRELQANAMALDWQGEYTLLAGRRALALIRLNNPSEVVKKVSRTQQKYDVTAAEWNPTQSQGHTFVLAFGERAEICQWSDSSLNGMSSLRAHTRTITDLNWHRMDPHLLATCSIDTFVHIWDTREPRKPVSSLSSIAGASQVKWNKLNQNMLASGHDCDIRVWDSRKTSQPIQFISAHLSKIQGLDWSPNHERHLVTSSNDCTVKFFDISNPRKAENFINTLSPVWRARYTPFGEGVVTVVAPQLRRGENPLLLWAVQDVTAPVHTFVGHSDMVLEFEWRLSGPGEHQLVTWARDHSLRIWRVDQHLQRMCGEEVGLGESTDSEFTSEAVTLGPVESEGEGEAGRELGLLGEEQDTPNMSGENEDVRSDSARQEGDPDPSVEKAQSRTSPECRSTTEASSAVAASGTADSCAGGDVSAASSVSSPQTLRSLATGQPMSLQQEFSLLNTSLDSSQVNSVEVVARRTKGQPSDVMDQEEEIITVKEEVIDEEVTVEVSHCTVQDEVSVECEVVVKEEVIDDEEVVSMGQNDGEKHFTEESVTFDESVNMDVSGNHGDTVEEEVAVIQADTSEEENVVEEDTAGDEITALERTSINEENDQLEEGIIEKKDNVQKKNILKGHLKEGDCLKEDSTHKKMTVPNAVNEQTGDTVKSGIVSVGDNLEERLSVQKDTTEESILQRGIIKQERGTVEGILEEGDTTVEKNTEQMQTEGNTVQEGGITDEKKDTEQIVIQGDTEQEGGTTEKKKDTEQVVTKGDAVQEGDLEEKRDTEQVVTKRDTAQKGGTTEEKKDTKHMVTEGDIVQERGTTEEKKDTDQMNTEQGTVQEGSIAEEKNAEQTETRGDKQEGGTTGEKKVGEMVETEGDSVQKTCITEGNAEKEGTVKKRGMQEVYTTEKKSSLQKRGTAQGGTMKEKIGTVQKRGMQEGHTTEEKNTVQKRSMQEEDIIQKGSAMPKRNTVPERNVKQEVDIEEDPRAESEEGHCLEKKGEEPLDDPAREAYVPLIKRESAAAAASAAGDGNGDEGGGGNMSGSTKDKHIQGSRTQSFEGNQEEVDQDPETQNPCGSESVVPHSTCIIKIHCAADDKDGLSLGEAGTPSKLNFKNSEGPPKSHSVSTPTVLDTPSVSLAQGVGEDFLKEEEVIHVECDTGLEMLDGPRERDEGVAVCQVVTSGSFVIKGAASSLMQVEASVVHLPESLTSSGQTPEEVWGSLAPQLLEGGVIVHGENLVLGALSLVTMVESVEVEGEPQTQITISPLGESVEAYHQRGVNFILVTKNSESATAAARCPPQHGADSESVPKVKPQGQNAPHSDTPGPFRCDKCDKTYSVRSSLNSHRVTHNAEKMYKCDECDRAFHYSTPLMIHKRTHSDERPYHCQTCLASFKSMTNLRCHQRQHSGERPIICPDCSRGFRDYTSLKRHRQRMHKTTAPASSDSSPSLTSSPQKAKVGGKSESDDKSPGGPALKEKGLGPVGRLSDYVHRCGLCQMTCHTRPQMLTHLQVHAAAERFRCRYCPSAYTFRFLLARHVRELHPGHPQWFCQHCDRIFDTCRKMNSHSCRSVRGNYSCPHNCGFTTEVRHRVFRHVARHHPEDAAPYHCDFCSNSYRDPGRLRYHQKRQHPEKMADLAPPPKDTWRALSESGPEDKGAVDMSQVEVSVMDEAIVYFLPEDLRNDIAFRERVKFKCFYCEAKFPVKNAMTRHVLRAHPGQRAYKCLRCNIFFRSNTESKNHNRKYHKYRDTGGRDPHRNEKAMKKRAQAVEEQLRHATPSLRSAYKFRCLHCPMAYRCKRPLVAHYRRWHPDQEWDHLPDRPSGPLPLSSSKRRKLLFYDCVFEPDCGRTFDELDLCLEHLLHAHEVSGDAALSHVKERMVVEGVRRGRLPKNAVVMPSSEAQSFGNVQRRQQWWKGRKRTKSETDTEMMEEEEDLEEEEMDDLDEEDEFDDDEMEEEDDEEEEEEEEEDEVLKIKSEDPDDSELFSKGAQESHPNPELSIKLEDIDSVGDVKKMLYRCRICGMSCNSKAQYRQHTASHTHSKEQQETPEAKIMSSSEKVPVLGTSKKKTSQLSKSESLEVEGGIQVTSLKEEVSEGEDDFKVLTLTPSASGPPEVKVDVIHSGTEDDDVKSSKASSAPNQTSPKQSQSSSPVSSSLPPTSSPKPALSKKPLSSRSASNNRESGQGFRRRGRPPKVQPPKGQRKMVGQQGAVGKRKAVGQCRAVTSKKLQCPECSMSFKTRSEMSFHKRLDH